MGRRKKSEDIFIEFIARIIVWCLFLWIFFRLLIAILGSFLEYFPVIAPVLLVGGGIYLYRKWPRSCPLCGNRLKRVSYRWTIDNKKQKVCPQCNQQLERKARKEAFGKITIQTPSFHIQTPSFNILPSSYPTSFFNTSSPALLSIVSFAPA